MVTIDKSLLEVPRGGRPKLELSDDDLIKLLKKRKVMSSREIAAGMGVSVSTVNRYLREARLRYAQEES